MVAATAVAWAVASAASAQCWVPGIGVPGLNGNAQALANWDPDGAGPMPTELVVGGAFTNAGGVPANRLARWNGTTWSAFGTGLNGSVFAITVLPGGDLVVGGSFSTAGGAAAVRVARWDGVAWSAMGSGMNDLVLSLTTLANGDVVAGGRFTTAGGNAASCVARWDGATWSPLGTGITGAPPYVNALQTLANGDLVAGGFFSNAGGVAVNSIARWNGTTWSALGVGISGVVNGLTTLPNGDLVVGGQFTNSGAQIFNRVARWNGTAWSGFGTGVTGPGFPLVWSVCTLPNGDLIAAGDFTTASGVPANYIARWDGAAWSALGSGTDTVVRALTVLDDGTLVVGGHFALAGGATANRIARYALDAAGPSFTEQPSDATVCPEGTAVFSVDVAGDGPFTYQWQWQPVPAGAWVNLSEGLNTGPGGVEIEASGTTSATLMVDAHGEGTSVRCVVFDTCTPGGIASDPGLLSICEADYNCDAVANSADFFDFLIAFFAGDADINGDGFTTSQDFFDFLVAFFAGC